MGKPGSMRKGTDCTQIGLQEYLDNLSCASAQLSLDGTILIVNKAFSRLIKKARKLLVGKKIGDEGSLDVTAEARKQLAAGVRKAARGKTARLEVYLADDRIVEVYLRPGVKKKDVHTCIFVEMRGLTGSLTVDQACKETVALANNVTSTETGIGEQTRTVDELRLKTEDIREGEPEFGESEERSRRLLGSAPATIMIYSEGKVVYINDAGLRYLHAKNPSDLIGRPVLDFVDPDNSEEVMARIRALATEERPARPIEEKLVCVDGVVINVEMMAIPYIYAGRPAVMTIFWEITGRKRVENAVRESQEMLSLIIDNIPQYVFWKDMNSVFTGCNKNFAISAGVGRPENIVGKTDYDLAWTKEESDLYRRFDREVMDNDRPVQHIIEEQHRADGRRVWLDTTKIPMKNASGEMIGILGTFEDITERKQIEEALQRSERQMFDIINHLPDATVAIDREGRIIAWNLAIEQMTGVRAAAMMGRGDYEYALPFYGTRRPILIDLINQPDDTVGRQYYNIARDGRALVAETSLPRLNGRNVVLWGRATPLLNEKGERIGAIETIRDITERKRAEEALQLTQFSVDHASDAVYWIKEDGSFAYVNEAACELLGYTRDELSGLRLYDIDPRLTQERWKERWKKIKTNPSRILEAKQRCKDGHLVPVEITSRYYSISGQEYDFAIARDMTERKRLFDALRESEEKFRVLADLSPTAICLYQGEKFFYTNRVMARMSGYTVEEQTGMYFWHFIHPDDREMVRNRGLQRQEGADVPNEYEFRIVTRTGEVRWVYLAAGRIEYKGQPAAIATFMDITERKQREGELRESEEKFRVLADTSPMAICLYQGNELFYVNNAMEKMFRMVSGLSAAENLDEKFWKYVHPDDREMVRNRGLQRQEGADVPNEYEFRIVTRTGEVRWVYLAAGRIEYRGKPAVIATYMDITDRKISEERIRNSLKEKEVLLKEIHHRVKNNMQIISSMLNLQIPGMKDAKDVEIFRESQNRIKSMALIHEKLYRSEDISRVDFGDYMQSLLESLYTFYSIEPGRIRLEKEIEKVYLDIDSAITCGMIANEIISNVLKHAFPGGRSGKISLKLSQDPGGLILLQISDDGVGLPEGFDINKTSTLGLQLITSLVDQLEAGMEIIKDNGLTYRIKFKPAYR